MAIPDFKSDGLLPPGQHETDLEEIEERLGFTPRRASIIGKFRNLIEEIPYKEHIEYVIINGSFVEDKPQPNDIDMVLVVPEVRDDHATGRLVKWVDERSKSIQATYDCHLFAGDEAIAEEFWKTFFAETRRGEQKGFVILKEVPS